MRKPGLLFKFRILFGTGLYRLAIRALMDRLIALVLPQWLLYVFGVDGSSTTPGLPPFAGPPTAIAMPAADAWSEPWRVPAGRVEMSSGWIPSRDYLLGWCGVGPGLAGSPKQNQQAFIQSQASHPAREPALQQRQVL